jgi:hypothetical protein
MRAPIVLLALVLSSAALASDAKPSPWKPAAEPAARLTAVIPRGTNLKIRLNRTIDTKHTRAGAAFNGELVQPVGHDGNLLLPKGTPVSGHVVESKPSGRLKGRAVLALRLDSVRWNGKIYKVSTASYTLTSKDHKKRDLALIGGGSGVGAGIGVIAGGGVGALAGAAVGGVAGTVGAAITGRRNVSLPAESVVSFPLASSMRL